MMVGNAIFAIISLAIVAIVITQVFISTVKGANTSSFSSGELALWGTVTLKNTGAHSSDTMLNIEEKTEKLPLGQFERKLSPNKFNTHNAYSLKLETEYNEGKSLRHLPEMKIYAEQYGDVLSDGIKSPSDNKPRVAIAGFVYNVASAFGLA